MAVPRNPKLNSRDRNFVVLDVIPRILFLISRDVPRIQKFNSRDRNIAVPDVIPRIIFLILGMSLEFKKLILGTGTLLSLISSLEFIV